ncbi:stress responsive A/B barrel domain-containing protein [Chaetomium sp. MPI-SDFR-AT-0129]|nr:stress responsive A/B barrel domain-containing protein [Chaetomium sp. MPI-SDFR-AT-0129]
MVDISGARPHAWRIAIATVTLLTLFLFFDPIGFASSSMDSAVATWAPGGTPGAVTHVVMFQFKSDADPAAVEAACAKMMSLREDCLAQNSNYPYIKSIAGGRDNSNEKLQHGATHAFVVEFASPDDRNYYVEHDPAHQAFKEEIAEIVEETIVLDFANGKF